VAVQSGGHFLFPATCFAGDVPSVTNLEKTIVNDQTIPNKDIIATVNNLIEYALDGQVGYLQAAAGVDMDALCETFRRYAREREGFITDLTNLVISLGGEPASFREATGTPTHAWTGIRVVVSACDNAAVLEECVRGEARSIEAYDDALNKHLPDHVHKVLRQQFERVEDAYDHMSALTELV
jgi:uncharacterized protein (TIGR02284 family)